MEPRPFERWCFDRRSSGQRRLAPEEHIALGKLRRRVAWRLAWPGAGLLAYGCVMFATLPDPAAADWLRGLHLFFLTLGALLLLPVAILLSRDSWREWRDVGRDLAEDRVECFEPSTTETGADLLGLVEVRHPSARVLTGPKGDVGALAPIRVVAPGPIIGMRVRHPSEGLPEGARLERRHLSPEERDEIQQAIGQIQRIPKTHVVPALWFLMCVWVWFQGGPRLTLGGKLLMVQGALMAGWVIGHAVRNHLLARRMREDAADGFALVFVPADPQASVEEEGLPHSGLPWRIAGLPAGWRGADLFGVGSR